MSNARERDRGFTLPELLIVTVMIALVTGVIAAALIVILRTAPGATVRADDSRTYQGLVTWLPRDIASSADDGSGIDDSPATLLCGGILATPGDIDLLQIVWTEDTGSPTDYIAIYRFEAVGNSKFAVRRYSCTSGGTATRINLTSPLSSTAPVVSIDTSGEHARVTMTFETRNDQVYVVGGEQIVVDAVTHNPSATLPTTTIPSEPPVETVCDATFGSSTYGPVGRKVTPPPQVDKLAASIPLQVTVSGDTCGTVELKYHTGITDVTQVVTATGTPGTYTVTIPAGAGGPSTPRWTAGNHLIAVTDDGNPLSGTTNLAVT